jgi:hypothetical protein
MRARFAYISSLGTTAILVAAALLMLAVVGAIVAFRGWPGAGAGPSGVRAVPLAPQEAARTVSLVRHDAKTSGVVRSSHTRPRATASARRTASTAGLVKQKAAGPRVVPGLVMEPVVASPMQAPPSSPTRAVPQQTPPSAPTPASAPARPLPDQPGSPIPSGTGGPTIPVPVPITAVPVPVPPPSPTGGPPAAEQVTTMVGTLLTGSTPPPPLLSALGLR